MRIVRDPETAAQKHYDLVIVGGGIYGVMLALEASLRECSVLLLEKEDFGGATSYNSLRIIHGGLRDLQTLNLRRYWEFGRERRWFLEHFPGLVERLPVLVPLYQRGLLRTDLFRIAFLLDRLLLPRRDRELSDGRFLPYGEVISTSEVERRFPEAESHNLSGGALWYDACVPDPQRLMVEVLRWVCDRETVALSHMKAVELLRDQNQVMGVRARDVLNGTCYDFSSEVVINAAGPWCASVARRFDREVSELHQYSIAWNILFDREAPSDCALGVRPPSSGEQIHFLHPWKGRLMAGTGHAPRETRNEEPQPSKEELQAHLEELNRAIPTLRLRPRDIIHVYAGYLPVKKDDVQLAKVDRIVDHAKRGGPSGLYTIRSTKLTAARATAEKVLSEVFSERDVTLERKRSFKEHSRSSTMRGVWDYEWYPSTEDSSWRESLIPIVEEESVHHLDDLMLRRTSLGDNPARALDLAPDLCGLFDWDEQRCQKEVRRVEDHFHWVHPSESPVDKR